MNDKQRYIISFNRGFTLMELLVVISIIVVLAAIILPTFAEMRRKAVRTHCLSNIRQVVTAGIDYAADNPYPRSWTQMRDFSWLEGYLDHHGVLTCPGSGNPPIPAEGSLENVTDFVFIGALPDFTDNDANRGHGNSDGFDPGNIKAARWLSYVMDKGWGLMIHCASDEFHGGQVNVGFFRDGSVQTQWGMAGLFGYGIDGKLTLELPDPLYEVRCYTCEGSGKSKNPGGNLTKCPTCNGDGVVGDTNGGGNGGADPGGPGKGGGGGKGPKK